MTFVSDKAGPRTIVLGVGNLVHTDDGLGVHAFRKLQADPRVPSGVELIDGGTFGIELLAYLENCSRLLLLDAVDVGRSPGALVRMAGEDLFGLPGGASVHQLGIADLLATLPLVSNAPEEVVLLGVQPGSTDWGCELTAPVAAALDALLELAIEQLQAWMRGATSPAAAATAANASASRESIALSIGLENA
jgi:hydrogenase maturation protease